MKINYSKKVLIFSTVVLIGVLVLDVIFTDLLLGRIMSINDKVKQWDISTQERAREVSLKSSIASSKDDREKLIGYFVAAGDVETLNFTKYLEDLALQNKVTQKKTLAYEAISELGSSDVVSAIRYRFSISGSWNNISNFLQAIENLPVISTINSVTFSVSSDKVWSADLDFSVAKLKK